MRRHQGKRCRLDTSAEQQRADEWQRAGRPPQSYARGKASGRFPLFNHLGRLKTVQVCHRALRVGRRLKDRPLVVFEHTQLRVKVACVIGSGLEFRHDAEIGAQEAAPELGNEFFAGTFGTILVIA